ncbi:MAG: hypothetical protein AMJ56_12840 [Anaerolineae bacterium SG8_19]|nr:MAG: hypothetical protein AMJ56_12840 [Anaerolineae bacterium SG8_19]
MHLAINAYFWNRPNTGSGQYTRQLVYHLDRLVRDLEITLIYPQLSGQHIPQDVPPDVNIKCLPLSAGHLGKVYFEQITFPRACRNIGADIAHVPYWGSPLQSPVPLVVTVHDVTTLIVREYRREINARLYNALVSASAKAAGHIITDSQASKRDIVNHLAVLEQNVTVIYLAASLAYKPQQELLVDMTILKKYDLPDLVLAGRKPQEASNRYPDYEGLINKLDLEDHIHWAGYIDEEDKPAVYRAASSFAFVSRNEGFGLPPLEAMSCGVPVVTSNCSSLPEVIGDAGFTLDPDDERQIAGSIIATIVQEDLAANLRQKGLAQAANFSWEKTATETLMVYDQLVGQ